MPIIDSRSRKISILENEDCKAHITNASLFSSQSFKSFSQMPAVLRDL